MARHKRGNYLTQGSLARKEEIRKYHDYDFETTAANIPVIREIQIKKANKSKKVGMVARVVIVFSLAMLVMFRYARITELGYEYNKYNELYQELKAENDRLSVEIEKSINLARVREVVEKELDMKKPESYQIIPIEVERIDVTERSENSSHEEEKGLIGKIVEWIKNFLCFLE